jgi:hypothetical protein
MVDGRITREVSRGVFDDPEQTDAGARLQYAERQLSTLLQKAQGHV